MKELACASLSIWIAGVVSLLAPLAAQEPTCRDLNRIEVDTGDGSLLRYTYQGTGTHYYGIAGGEAAKEKPKAGAFEKGKYTCWHPRGWQHVEIAFDAGIRLTIYDATGKAVLTLRSEGLETMWHPTGRQAFGARGGRFLFCNADGSVAADVRLCQEIWQAWGAEVEVDEEDVWHELLYDQHAKTLLPRLIEGIRHADPWVSAQACEAIESFGDNAVGAVPALRQALVDDRFWLVRQRAARALWNLGPLAHAAVPDLVRVASDRDEDVTTRRLAARALGDIGAKAAVAVPALEAAAKLAPPDLQVEITAALGWIDPAGRTTVQTLAGQLADPQTALPAAFTLYYRYRGVAGAARDAVLRESKKQGEAMTELAWQLSELLYHIDPKAPQPAWAEGSNSNHPILPRRALVPEALLTFCMLDADQFEIKEAIGGLCECPGSYFQEQMREYPSTIGPEARAAAPGLVRLLAALDDNVVQWAARALAHIGPVAIPELTAALQPKRGAPLQGFRVLETLAAYGAPAVPAIVTVLGHQDEVLHELAATALGRMGPAAKDALPALRQALQSPREEMREAAALAIARIEGAAARSPLQPQPKPR